MKKRLTPIARGLRKRATEHERILWRHLRDRQLSEFKFRRQVPLCGYVVDFACFESKVVVELDGSQHATKQGRAADAVRDAVLAEAGFRVLRFWNRQVTKELPMVLETIYEVCRSRQLPPPCPSPIKGEET